VLVIPDFQSDGNLPAGVHDAFWSEFASRYGINPHRERLASGLQRVLTILRQAGCTDAFVDGSYVTAKPLPRDYDAAWSMVGVDLVLLRSLEPILFDFTSGRAAQKAKFLGELFPAEMQEGLSGRTFLNFFETDRDTGQPKGIVRIGLRTLP